MRSIRGDRLGLIQRQAFQVLKSEPSSADLAGLLRLERAEPVLDIADLRLVGDRKAQDHEAPGPTGVSGHRPGYDLELHRGQLCSLGKVVQLRAKCIRIRNWPSEYRFVDNRVQ